LNEIFVNLPKCLTLASGAIRAIYDRSNSVLKDVFLQQSPANRYVVLDGILFLDLLELPELPKSLDFWTIRPLISNNLSVRKIPYPFSRSSDEHAAEKEESEKDDDTAIFVSLSVGTELFIHPMATVKWWCEHTSTWRSDGISDVEIDRTKGMVQFKTNMLRPCALVQVRARIYLSFSGEISLMRQHKPVTFVGCFNRIPIARLGSACNF
jgi:hypothetical protein